jgi:2,4-dienoyl-CoA reductase-like NADH-dependent reductase (Old Yellow Enzyme family)
MSSRQAVPSAIPLRLGKGLFATMISKILFGTPRAMTVQEIHDVQNRFVETAVLASEAGFDGIELHGAHGYLLPQFLTAKTNQRVDGYGGTARARAKIVVDIIEAIRDAVPKSFTVGIKFNSVDHQSSIALEECLEQLQLIIKAGIDFLEVSGGSYEEPIVGLSFMLLVLPRWSNKSFRELRTLTKPRGRKKKV